MNPGKDFEIESFNYLQKTFNFENITFVLEGGMDSTRSDVAVLKNGEINFYIEAKEMSAQCGQFVLFPDDETNAFVFSSKNKSPITPPTQIIIDYMNANYDLYKTADTNGISIDLPSTVLFDWIMTYYKMKGVKYFISKLDDFVIIPINELPQYFNVSAAYRVKKSGSSTPPKRDLSALTDIITSLYPNAKLKLSDKRLYVEDTTIKGEPKFSCNTDEYMLALREDHIYEARKLSNTMNRNVIFSISLKRPQSLEDLAMFKKDLLD